MWLNAGNNSFDMKEVSAVMLQEDDGKIVMIMKNGQQFTINITGDGTPSETYDSITHLLKEMRESEERDIDNSFELLKRILSELNLISQNLRRL